MIGFLALLQQAQPNTIYVERAPGGIPEWERTLITASIGAFVGVVSSILMEYVKPYIANRVLRGTVARQIKDELIDNMTLLKDSQKMLGRARRKGKEAHSGCLRMVLLNLICLESDRYFHYFSTAKSVLYRLDEKHSLTDFYRILKQLYSPGKAASEYDFGSVQFGVELALERAMEYCENRGIKYVRRTKYLDAAIDINANVPIDDEDLAEPTKNPE